MKEICGAVGQDLVLLYVCGDYQRGQVRGQDNNQVSVLSRMDWWWYRERRKRMPEGGTALWGKMSLVLPVWGLRYLWTVHRETWEVRLYTKAGG